tara:strand:+ start:928 stop:1146 length:219 start_codon:yes stop_codon:yes gene_type:complete
MDAICYNSIDRYVVKMSDYVPCFNKQNLVDWAITRFPNEPKSKFYGMKKSQLWAIWFNYKKIKDTTNAKISI